MKKLKKRVAATLAAGAIALLPIGSPVAEAWSLGDAVNVLNGVIGMSNVYYSIFENLIVEGGFAQGQNETIEEGAATLGGYSENQNEIALVDGVMHQLIEDGKYFTDARGLPFRWKVYNTNVINAECFHNNAIRVYHGILNDAYYDRDMVAGILGHEMTHGINHHGARHIAANFVKHSILDFAYSNYGSEDQKALVLLMYQYDAAKNTMLPDELEADEQGFYIAASAGFNPGGAAAYWSGAWEKQNRRTHPDFEDFFHPSDHPDVDKRVKNMYELLKKYGYNHVLIKDDVNVYIDDTLFFTAQPEGDYLAPQVAYLVAGGLAKNFHDQRLSAMWDFRHNKDGSITYEPQGDAYKWARRAVNDFGKGALLEELVAKAYSTDSKVGARDEIYAEEQERLKKIDERTSRLSELEDVEIGVKFGNAEFYNKHGLYDHAIAEANHILSCKNSSEKQKSFAHNDKGIAYNGKGKYAEAIKEYTTAISLHPNYAGVFKNRAASYNMIGEYNNALADCETAMKFANDTDEKAAIYSIGAVSCDAIGDETGALERYRQARSFNASVAVPEKYASRLE